MPKSAQFRPNVERLEDRYAPATLTVTTLRDGVPGSLRSAIHEANQTAAADTIVFAPGLTGTIALTRGEEIFITSNLTIAGPGANALAISGNYTSGIFRIENNVPGPDVTVRLSGLELSHGSSQGRGGAIWTQENLVVNGVRFSFNEATSEGGAIEANLIAGKLNVVNCTFLGNTGRLGGAISAYATTKIIGSTFLANTATHTNGGGGGGVSLIGPATISGSKFLGNKAPGVSGGGISHSLGALKILNSKISSNSSGIEGGGISAENLEIRNSIVTNNRSFAAAQSTAGGGISCRVATISGCTISNNRSDFGGALSCLSANVTASTIADNYATHTGGGIDAQFAVVVKGSTISSNLAGGGGGIYTGEATLENCTVAGNRAIYDGFGAGGGLKCHTVTLRSCTFSNNSSDNSGGGLLIRTGGGTSLISQCTFSGNIADQAGGGLHLSLTAHLRIAHSTIAFNSATPGGTSEGGGLYLGIDSTFGATLYGCLIANNTATVGADVRTADNKFFESAYCLYGQFVNTDATLKDPTDGSGDDVTTINPGSNLLNVNARLAPLANNGGRTKTHALGAASPAINRGRIDPALAPIATDQRGAGFKRKVGANVDIGAFERQ